MTPNPKQLILKFAPTPHVHTMALVTAKHYTNILHHYIVDPNYHGLGFAQYLAAFDDELDINMINVYADIMQLEQHHKFFVMFAEDVEFTQAFHAIPLDTELADNFKRVYNQAHATRANGIITPNAFVKHSEMNEDALELLDTLFIIDTAFATFIKGDNPERAHRLIDGVTRQDAYIQRDYLDKIKYP